MKKAIAILCTLALTAAVLAVPASGLPRAAVTEPVVLVIQGGPESDVFSISLDADGRHYTIESNVALKVAETICWSTEENGAFQLRCNAKAISGMRINGGEGDDTIRFSPRVPIPVTLSGEGGNDTLEGGAGADVLRGGPGSDTLFGNGGWDQLEGSEGDDVILGGPGSDNLLGNRGNDRLVGEGGDDHLFGGSGEDTLIGGPGGDLLVGGPGTDSLFGGSGHNVLRP